MTDAPKNQEEKILWTLQAAWPGWVPAPALSRIALQYGRSIFSLRKKGWLIENRVRIVDGVKHGEFHLGPRPTLSSRELRQSAPPPAPAPAPPTPTPPPPPAGDSLFDMERTHRDEG